MTALITVSFDAVAYVVAGYILEKLGPKVSLASLYAVAGIGSILMLSFGL